MTKCTGPHEVNMTLYFKKLKLNPPRVTVKQQNADLELAKDRTSVKVNSWKQNQGLTAGRGATTHKCIKQATSTLWCDCVFQMSGARTLTCPTGQCWGWSLRGGIWAMVHSCQDRCVLLGSEGVGYSESTSKEEASSDSCCPPTPLTFCPR